MDLFSLLLGKVTSLTYAATMAHCGFGQQQSAVC